MAPTYPLGDPVEAAAVNTTGLAYAIPTADTAGRPIEATYVKVWCSAKCYVAFGVGTTPSAVADWDRAVQQIGETEVYTRSKIRDATRTHVWVAAKSGTTDVDISYFG